MAWKESCRVEERLKFVLEYGQTPQYGFAALCRKYGVSRKTGYKWVHRYDPRSPDSLLDQSRRPKTHPHQTPERIESALIAIRRERPTWGPKKLVWAFGQLHPDLSPPSISTVANILKRHGLIHPRRRRRRTPPFSSPFAGCDAPNDVWCADFKGHFKTGRAKCHPLTITDAFSRYIIRCQALRRTRRSPVMSVFDSAFRELGLPRAIRTDNGPPFASPAIGGLSELSVWWMRLGIRPERIEPGKPQQNGRHERMHRTLKAETASPPASSFKAQQRRFDEFRIHFNQERPHEALGQSTPASWYATSTRRYPRSLPKPDYPYGMYTFLVPNNGILPWRGKNIYLSSCLAGQYIALHQVDEQVWQVFFCSLRIGCIRRRTSTSRGLQFVRERAPSFVDLHEL